jgi:threonine dehydrogenase-like Zn-dependent dehydrogenase
MNKNLAIRMGDCNHRSIIPRLVDQVRNGAFDPLTVPTNREPMMDVLDAVSLARCRDAVPLLFKEYPEDEHHSLSQA